MSVTTDLTQQTTFTPADRRYVHGVARSVSADFRPLDRKGIKFEFDIKFGAWDELVVGDDCVWFYMPYLGGYAYIDFSPLAKDIETRAPFTIAVALTVLKTLVFDSSQEVATCCDNALARLRNKWNVDLGQVSTFVNGLNLKKDIAKTDELRFSWTPTSI